MLTKVSKLVIQSFAKVNLFLKALNKRPDNYHNINTLFERISLSDKITLKARRDHLIKVICLDQSVPSDESNLCWRAAKLLQDNFRVKKGVDIGILKRIPVGAGLGGGSSNAAATLIGLNNLWKLNISKPKLAKLAGKLGSDVSFFIYEVPFAQGERRGEKIRILSNLNKIKLWHILIVPKIHVSTPLIYKKWDKMGPNKKQVAGLTKQPCNVKILTSALAKNASLLKPGLLFNSLEKVTLKLYPEVKRIKEKLAALGLKNILMSGSGPAVFAIVSSRKKALALSNRLKRNNGAWRIFAVCTD